MKTETFRCKACGKTAKLESGKRHWCDCKLEQAINHVIAHGEKIEEHLSGLGVVWPTLAQEAASDAHFDKMESAALASAEKELSGMEKRIVGGEVRYYKTPTLYTPAVKRGRVRRWFEVRADGDYAVKP
jgi:hypothetical protein